VKEYYECHVTMVGRSDLIRLVVERSGWLFSAIDGDPDLGPGVKCYATKQFNAKNPKEDVVKAVESIAVYLGSYDCCDVVRSKVELVVYDSRSKPCAT